MGHHVSFACVKGKDRAEVLEALDLEELPGGGRAFDSRLSVADLPSGWVVLASSDFVDAMQPDWLEALASGGCEVIACQVEDRVMASRAVGYWADGSSWSVNYDCENGDDLDVDGSVPDQLAAIEASAREKHFAPDAEADYIYDVPADLVKALTGYRYDAIEFSPGVKLVFNPLHRKRAAKTSSGGGPSFFARLFGRK